MEPLADGPYATTYILVEGQAFHSVEHPVIQEERACIYVNGRELATLMCSPHQLEDLAVGFLRSEELITRYDDIAILNISAHKLCVDIWLRDANKALPKRRIMTSGCGGGVTFDDLCQARAALPARTWIEPAQVGRLMRKLYQAADLYQETQGVHTAALSDGQELLLVAEDVGRHNTIDRLWGQALKHGVATQDRIVISTGRISSEMLGKMVKMGVPIVISRTSPTSLSVELARAWNITLIGYARGDTFRIYSAADRVARWEQVEVNPPALLQAA